MNGDKTKAWIEFNQPIRIVLNLIEGILPEAIILVRLSTHYLLEQGAMATKYADK